MPKRTGRFLTLVLLYGVCQAGVCRADSAPFIGHMPQVTVELVAITYWPPTKQSQWWQPDGSLTAVGPFLPQNPKPMPVFTLQREGVDGKVLVCLVRFENLPADASDALGGFDSSTTLPWFAQLSVFGWPWSASLEGSNVTYAAHGPLPSNTRLTGRSPLIAGLPSWHAANSTGVVDGRGVPAQEHTRSSHLATTDWAYRDAPGKIGREYYEMFYVSFLASAPMTNFRIGISMGTWETVLTKEPDHAGRQVFSRDGDQWTITFQNNKATLGNADGKTLVKHTVPRGRLAMRLVTVAADGTEHATLLNPSAEDTTPVFHDRSLSSIKEFRLQVRPYYWVEFQGVSLQRGQKTSVQVVSPDASANATK